MQDGFANGTHRTGGLTDSFLYMVNSDVPGGVFEVQGFSLVPLSFAINDYCVCQELHIL
jgi:hypothetical protein